MPSVLFVCTANQFRSPLAAGMFKRALAREEQERKSPWPIGEAAGWEVDSAGILATPGLPVLPDVLEAGRQLGMDLSAHRTRRVDQELLNHYDLVLVMQEDHRDLLHLQYPDLRDYIYLLSMVVDDTSYNIPDTHRFLKDVLVIGEALNDMIRRNMHYICVLAMAMHNRKNMDLARKQ